MDSQAASKTFLKMIKEERIKKKLVIANTPSHLRLFKREGIQLMNEEDFNYLLNFTNNVIKKKLPKVWKENEDQAKDYMFRIISFQKDPAAIERLIEILNRSESVLVQVQLNLQNLKTKAFYRRLFEDDGKYNEYKMDKLSAVLEPQIIVEFLLNKNCYDYEPMLERVQFYLNNKQVEDAACEMLRGLPYCSDSINSGRRLGEWYYDFLEACLTHGYTRMLPCYIDPNFASDLGNFRATVEAENKKQVLFDQDLIESDMVPDEPRNQADYNEFRILSADILYQPAEYQLRPYQNELVAHANRGRNTIVCAPTGCGKTLVATEIILTHLRNKHKEGKIARALMLVPTVPLVDQQTVELVKYLAGEFWVDGFSGAENLTNRAGNFLASDICVVTPQIVINMMNSILKQEKIYFSDITLMIFDECHNCNEQHPYKILMEMLEESGVKEKPQIVGLTASLGVGQTSWDITACREHMLKMCSYLLADSISTVRHQLENLKSHVMPPVDIVQRAKRPSNDEFAQIIKETMIKIQERMMPDLEKLLSLQIIPITKEDISFPDHRYTSKYQNVVGGLRKSLQRVSDSNIRLWLVRSIDHLSHYFHAISISDLLPNQYGLKYLDSKMSIYNNSLNEDDVNKFLLDSYNSIRKRLRQLAKDEKSEDKEILQKLYGILHEQYSEKPESRTLIFVATRACAQRLSEHLSEYLEKCEVLRIFYKKPNQAGYMTSTNQSAAAGGQSGDMQRTMRDKFKRGEIKILVVTSVADEGINIMECNLIIKYNSVGSERTLIQRRGRARDKDSRAILLALDTGVEQQEFDNMKKEAMMLECIKDLQAHQDEALRKMIADKTEKLKLLYEQKRDNLQKQREMLSTRKYQLKCRACNGKICDSMDVRSVASSFYVCVDPLIWTRSKNEIIKKPTKDGLTTKCAKWVCGTCGEEWGNVVKFSNVFLPSLTAKSFVMERFDTKEQMISVSVKKGGWNQIQTEYFNIDPIRSRNIKDMLHALIKVSEEDHAMMERQEVIANQMLMDRVRDQPEKRIKQYNTLDE